MMRKGRFARIFLKNGDQETDLTSTLLGLANETLEQTFETVTVDNLIVTTKTPVNAVSAGTVTWTFTDTPVQGEYWSFGDDVYEIDIDETGVAQPGAIAVPLVTGSVTKEHTAAAFETVFNASGTTAWTAADQLDGTVECDPDAAGVIGNGIVSDASNATKTAVDVSPTADGVDGTVGSKGEIRWDASYVYVCVLANTIADANWERAGIASY